MSSKDNIIFSSKEIPGNEKAISYLKNSFSYLGLNIISDEDDFVHVSGHPGIHEIKEFYQYVKPLSLIPMHGEYLHLKKHLQIAHDLKIDKTLLLLSGDLCELDLNEKKHKLIDQFIIKKLPVIQSSIIEDMNFLNERGKMLNNGIVSVNLILNKQNLIPILYIFWLTIWATAKLEHSVKNLLKHLILRCLLSLGRI